MEFNAVAIPIMEITKPIKAIGLERSGFILIASNNEEANKAKPKPEKIAHTFLFFIIFNYLIKFSIETFNALAIFAIT